MHHPSDRKLPLTVEHGKHAMHHPTDRKLTPMGADLATYVPVTVVYGTFTGTFRLRAKALVKRN